MDIIFTTPMLMHPAASGPHLRIENSIKALAKVCDLHIISQVTNALIGGREAVDFYQSYAKIFLFSPQVVGLSACRHWRRMQILMRKCYASDARFLVNYARKHNIKVIWFGYGNLSYPLIKKVKALAPDLRLICDTDSVWSRFISRELPFCDSFVEKRKLLRASKSKEQEELAWVNLCEVTTAVSEVDAEYYRNLTQDKNKIAIFSNMLDLENYAYPSAQTSTIKSPALYLAGSFGKATSAMNRAATWLLNDILPLVKETIPNVHTYIVGNHSDISFGHIQDPSITVTGKVECVLPYLKNVDVALTPLHFESGTRFKILEAAACKIPMVSTTLGAEGLPVKDQEHLLIADTTESFAKAIITLLQNKTFAKELAENSFKLIQENYSLRQLSQEAENILEKVSKS